MDTKGGTVGGGLILQYIGKLKTKTIWYVDYMLEQSIALLPYAKVAITVLVAWVVFLILLRMFGINKIRRGRAMTLEMRNVNAIKARDRRILRQTNLIKATTKFIQNTPLRVTKLRKEYLDYQLSRAGFSAPGGYRPLVAEEFNSLVQIVQLAGVITGLAVSMTVSTMGGVLTIAVVIMVCTMVPNLVLSSIVNARDDEIRANFSEMYLMIHYTLVSGAQTPLDRVLRSYGRTTDSAEMKRFVNNCCSRIDTYGEYHATEYIAKDYRRIAEVAKLMRLIKQLREGGDVQQELLGFREELMTERRIALEKRGDQLVAKANRTMVLIYIVLIQAVCSAVMIYATDLQGLGGILGVG